MKSLRRLLPLIAASALLLPVSCGEKVGLGSGYDSSASITPRSTSLEADGGSIFVSVTASGSWTVDLEFPDDSGEWATMDPASGSGSRSDLRLRYDPNTTEDSRTVVLVLKPSGSREVRATVTQYGVGGSSSTDGSGQDVAAPGWLELPATKAGDGRYFYVHDMSGHGYVSEAESGMRNWSFYWDKQEHMSLWVAYPLNSSLRGNGSRTNAWGLDPLIPYSDQPNLTGGSYGGGWTRGHQIPSADRLTYDANVSTFYGTNMTPQEYNFNSFIWGDLEGKVRGYAASSDTLYVVTGCLFDSSTEYSGNSSGFYVKIPTHYFKALLYRGPSTYATDGFMCAGFLLPHDSSIARGNCLDYIMSISQLERETGIEFFPNLKKVVGESTAAGLKASEPSIFWK